MRQTTSVRNASNAFLQDAFRFHNRALWHGARQKPTLSSSKTPSAYGMAVNTNRVQEAAQQARPYTRNAEALLAVVNGVTVLDFDTDRPVRQARLLVNGRVVDTTGAGTTAAGLKMAAIPGATNIAVHLLLMILALMVLVGCRSGSRSSRTLEPFLSLQTGMTLQEVTNRVGAPDCHAGSGVFRWEYDLADGSTVMVYPARETPIRDFSVSKVARIVQRHGTNWISDTLDESRKQKQ